MPRKYSEEEIRQWKIIREVGFSYREISELLDVSFSTLLYNLNPDVKEKQRAYWQIPEVKEKKRAYRQRPEVKERQRAYRQRSVLSAWHGYDGWLSTERIKKKIGTLRDFKETMNLLEKKEEGGVTLYRPKAWVISALNS